MASPEASSSLTNSDSWHSPDQAVPAVATGPAAASTSRLASPGYTATGAVTSSGYASAGGMSNRPSSPVAGPRRGYTTGGLLPNHSSRAAATHSASASARPSSPRQGRQALGKSTASGPSRKAQLGPGVAEKAAALRRKLQGSQEGILELRQEASVLQEYSSAKLERVQDCVARLLNRTTTLDGLASEWATKTGPIRRDRRRLLDMLLASQGAVQVVCRVRPPFENEGPLALSFPDGKTVRVAPPPPQSQSQSQSGGSSGPGAPGAGPGAPPGHAARKEFEFDRVLGPQVSQEALFAGLQTRVQTALDGANVLLVAYGHAGSGKSHTMEGPVHDRGLFFRVFDELSDLASSSYGPPTSFAFTLSVLEMYNEQLTDLLFDPNAATQAPPLKIEVRHADGAPGPGPAPPREVRVEGAVERKVAGSLEYAKAMKLALQHRAALGSQSGTPRDRAQHSHLIVSIGIAHSNPETSRAQASKVVMVDLACSERLGAAGGPSGDRLAEALLINKAHSAVGECFSALASKRPSVPWQASQLTTLLADCLSPVAKAVLLVACSPSERELGDSLATLNYGMRARGSEISFGSKDSFKKWKDAANEARREQFELERELGRARQEVVGLREDLRRTGDTSLVLLKEVHRSWVRLGALEAQRQQEIAAFTEEMARMEAAFQREAEELETQFVVERARADKDHEEALENMHSDLVSQLETHKVQLAHATQRLAEAADVAAMVASGAGPGRGDGGGAPGGAGGGGGGASAVELEELRKELAASRAAVDKYKLQLEKAEELSQELNQENATLLAKLQEAKQEMVALEEAAVLPEKKEAPTPEEAQAQDAPDPSSPEALLELQRRMEHCFGAQREGQPAAAAGDASAKANRANELLDLALKAVAHGRTAGGYKKEAETVETLKGAVLQLVERAREGGVPLNMAAVGRAKLAMLHVSKSLCQSVDSLGKARPFKDFLCKQSEAAAQAAASAGPPLVSPKGGGGFLHRSTSSSGRPQATPAAAPPALELRQLAVDLGFDSWQKAAPAGADTQPALERRRSGSFRLPSFRSSSLAKGGIERRASIDSAPSPAIEHQITPQQLSALRAAAAEHAKGNRELALAFLLAGRGEAVEAQVLQWVGSAFRFWASGAPPADAAPAAVAAAHALIEGWTAGLATPMRYSPDALALLLKELSRLSYHSQLANLEDMASSLIGEEVEDLDHAAKLEVAVQTVLHKQRKIIEELTADREWTRRDEVLAGARASAKRCEERALSLVHLQRILQICRDTVTVYSRAAPKRSDVASLQRQVGEARAGGVPRLVPLDAELGARELQLAEELLDKAGAKSRDDEKELSEAGNAKPVRRPLWGLLAAPAGEDGDTEAGGAPASMLGLTFAKPTLPAEPSGNGAEGSAQAGPRVADAAGASGRQLDSLDEQGAGGGVTREPAEQVEGVGQAEMGGQAMRSLEKGDGFVAGAERREREGGGEAAAVRPPSTALDDAPAEAGGKRERAMEWSGGAQGSEGARSAAASSEEREPGAAAPGGTSVDSLAGEQAPERGATEGAREGATGGAAQGAAAGPRGEAGGGIEAAAARAVAAASGAREPGARSLEEPAPRRGLYAPEYSTSTSNGTGTGTGTGDGLSTTSGPPTAGPPIAHTRSHSAASPGSVQGMASSGYTTPRSIPQFVGGDILRQPVVGGALQSSGALVQRQGSSNGNSTAASAVKKNSGGEAGPRPGPWAQEFAGALGGTGAQDSASGELQATQAGGGGGSAASVPAGEGPTAGERAEAGVGESARESEGGAEGEVDLRRTSSGEHADTAGAPERPPLRDRVQRTLTQGAEGRTGDAGPGGHEAQQQWLGQALGQDMDVPWLGEPGREGGEGEGEGEREREEERWSTVQLNTPDGLIPIQCSKDAGGALLVRFEGDLDPEGPLGDAENYIIHDRGKITVLLPPPAQLEGVPLAILQTELKLVLPAEVCKVVVAKNAATTRARYGRIYNTLAERAKDHGAAEIP